MCDKSLDVLKEDKTLNNEDLEQVTGGVYRLDENNVTDYEIYVSSHPNEEGFYHDGTNTEADWRRP